MVGTINLRKEVEVMYEHYCNNIADIKNDKIRITLKHILNVLDAKIESLVVYRSKMDECEEMIEEIKCLEEHVAYLEKCLEECTREPKVIAVDFDGTLCEENWPGIGEPKTQMIEYLKELKLQGDKLILWTCRVDEKLDEAVDWCLDQGLIFDAVNDNLPELVAKYGGNPRKVFADIYLDDRAADCMFLEDVKEDRQ